MSDSCSLPWAPKFWVSAVDVCLCCWVSREERISWIALFLLVSPHEGNPSDLFSRYTLWYTSLISFRDVQYPTNPMADWSALELGSLMLFWWPRRHIHSASFCPRASACRNISCKMTDQCGVPRLHWEYSSRKSSDSTTLSASLKESPFSSARQQASRVFSILLP